MLERLQYLWLLLIFAACNPAPEQRSVNKIVASNDATAGGFGQTFATENDLPSCSAGSDNEIAFIKATNKLVVCKDAKWQDINLTDTDEKSNFNTYPNEASLPACDASSENTVAYILETSTIMQCAASEWSQAGASNGQQVFETQELAGECNDAREGEFSFITADKKFIHCVAGTWTDVDVSGEDGTKISDAWREVWTNNVQSTARILNVVNIYSNTDAALTPLAAKQERCQVGGTGSGFIVAQDIVATNAHVAETWHSRTLASISRSCRGNESQEVAFNRIFDFCLVPQLPTPDVTTIADVNAQTGAPLLSLVDNTQILNDDAASVQFIALCYDIANRADPVNLPPFATIAVTTADVIEQSDGANPTSERTLQIDFNLSRAVLNPTLGNATITLAFPDALGKFATIDDPTFPIPGGLTVLDPAASVPVTNMDMSVGASDDLALLEVATGQRTPVTLSQQDFAVDGVSDNGTRLNEDVLLIGYSRGDLYAHFVTGKINQAMRFDIFNIFVGARDRFFTSDDRIVYMYDLVSAGGSSGSCVFNLAGECIAYNFAGDTTAVVTDFGYGLQILHLRNLLAAPRNWIAPNLMPAPLVRVP